MAITNEKKMSGLEATYNRSLTISTGGLFIAGSKQAVSFNFHVLLFSVIYFMDVSMFM